MKYLLVPLSPSSHILVLHPPPGTLHAQYSTLHAPHIILHATNTTHTTHDIACITLHTMNYTACSPHHLHAYFPQQDQVLGKLHMTINLLHAYHIMRYPQSSYEGIYCAADVNTGVCYD